MRFSALGAVMVALFPASTQSVSPRVNFEVASVKLAQPPNGGAFRSGVFGGPTKGDPGEIRYLYLSLARLIMEAYGIVNPSLLSGPDWINTTRFDIVAKLPPGTTAEQVPRMLQNLLVERLKLRVHHESRPMTVYDLTIARGGPKLRAAAGKSTSEEAVSGVRLSGEDSFPELPAGQNGGITIDGRARWQRYNATTHDLAEMLTRELHATVTDATGLSGKYDISLYWVTGSTLDATGGSNSAVSGPTVFSAVGGQLGLRLASKRGLADILIVDSAERGSPDN